MADLFDLRPESVGSFLDDETIQLPRFQRRSAWKPEQRFRLALSLFKGYPLGTVVVKKEKSQQGGIGQSVTYLLDGRQRRETLAGMRDPETIYSWARTSLKLRAQDDTDEVIAKFQKYVDNYFFGQEDWEEDAEESDEPDAIDETTHSEYQDTGEEDDEASDEASEDESTTALDDQQYAGLEDLWKLVLLVHPLTKGGRDSGFRKPFNFDKSIKGLDFVKQDELGKRSVNSDALLSWLKYQRDSHKGTPWPPSQQTFYEWLTAGKTVDKPDAVKKRLDEEWPRIEKAILLLESLKARLTSSVLGYLEIRDSASSNDDKKIFEIINTAGTKLSAAEILSAKVAWDEEVDSPPAAVLNNVKDLYDEMGIDFDGRVRRWDVAATLLDRIDFPVVLGQKAQWEWDGIKSKHLERKITLGFKLLSGYYQSRLKKNEVARLPSVPEVSWGTIELESKFNEVSRLLGKHWFFEYVQAWDFSLAGSLSDAIGLDYLLVCTKDWIRKGEPKVAGAPLNSFRKNAVVLFDRLVYEYVTEVWRGSSDNRIARNLDAINQSTDPIFGAVPKAEWERLVEEVVDDGTVNGVSYLRKQDQRVRHLLTYAMIIARIRPDDVHEPIEVDHIVPQQLFKESGDKELASNLHHISNLQLLPESVNNAKSSRRLNELTQPNVRGAVARFSRVHEKDFDLFSDVASSALLRDRRGVALRGLLLEERVKVLNEPDSPTGPDLWVDAT